MEVRHSMAKLKQSNKYYFTVEGETEKWYFDWLQKTINETDTTRFKVNFDCKIHDLMTMVNDGKKQRKC